VDFVCLAPNEFGKDETGLVAYAQEFNRTLAVARERIGPFRDSCRNAELMPAWLYRQLLECSTTSLDARFGRVGLSVIRNAKVFLCPLSDFGFSGGLIGIGGVGLPTASGRTVGAVSVMGDHETASAYPAIIRRALARCAG
jgi:hypothetical protein